MGFKMFMFLGLAIIFIISTCSGPKTEKVTKSDPVAAPERNEADETRKKQERDHARAQRDAMQPMLIQMCRDGNNDACRQVREWENVRKY
jgi:hypothetical protein